MGASNGALWIKALLDAMTQEWSAPGILVCKGQGRRGLMRGDAQARERACLACRQQHWWQATPTSRPLAAAARRRERYIAGFAGFAPAIGGLNQCFVATVLGLDLNM